MNPPISSGPSGSGGPTGSGVSAERSPSYFLITGAADAGEVFLGRALEETRAGVVLVEGKSVGRDAAGGLALRPFATRWRLNPERAHVHLHQLSGGPEHEEARALLEGDDARVEPTRAPLLHAWIRSALAGTRPQRGPRPAPASSAEGRAPLAGLVPAAADPFEACRAFHTTFARTSEGFRRSLFLDPRVRDTRALDQATELEGNLRIELGKLANQAAVRFAELVRPHRELEARLAAGGEPGVAGASELYGWAALFARLQGAKTWARASGQPDLVRDANRLVKDAVFGLNELILDHVNALDTLITETFAQYGIEGELDDVHTPGLGAPDA